jgi:hypothetical protein
MSWVSVGVAGGSALLNGWRALKSNQADKAAAREGASLRRPFYQIQPEYFQNRNIAEATAGQGFSSAEKQAMDQQRERGLTTSIGALEEMGGGVNDLSHLGQVFTDSLTSEAAEDAKLHLQNIKFFTDANKDVAAQKNIQWGVNELQPYESKLKEIQDRRTAAQTNRSSAIDATIGSLSAAATGINTASLKTPGASTPAKRDLGPYSAQFGLADVGGTGFNDPASQFSVLNPLAASNVQAGM